MNKILHIAFVVSHYPHSAFGHDGGLGTSVYNLVEKLKKVDVLISVFVYGQKEDFKIEEENVTIYSIKDRQCRFFKFFFYRKTIEQFINKKVNEKGINLIEAPDWTGITAFMKFKIPLVIRFHGSDTYFCHLEQRKQKRKNFFFEKLAVAGAKAYIAPTDFAGALSQKLFQIKNKTIKTIYYGLDLNQFQNSKPADFERGLLLYSGTLIRKKGVLELPAIFNKVRKEFPNARLLLIGGDAPDILTNSNSTWELMKSQFEPDDLEKVSYVGRMPYDQMQAFIQKAHVCVYPTYAETLGMVTIEAMAMQKAVVNSNIGWAQEVIIDGESGFLAHPSDHNLFAKRVLQLIQNQALTENIGQQARKRVENVFDINTLVDENLRFYEELLEKIRK